MYPLKYLCPISVLRKGRRESVIVEIWRPIIDGVRLLMPHPTSGNIVMCMYTRARHFGGQIALVLVHPPAGDAASASFEL